MNSNPIRVRMAPSPTGFFHVGSARTALFNFLFARHNNATFVLRIEDTDAARGRDEFEQVVYDAMAWLGLSTDEGPKEGGDFGPYRQSERFEIYKKFAAQLLESGRAYLSFETPEELAAMREEQMRAKQAPRYNGAHRDLTPDQRAELESQGRKSVLRLRIPEGETHFKDAVYGEIKVKNAEIDDFVIQKSDGGPTYNFACAIDDHLMQISHVIRGEDGLSNTPRQILIYQSLGWEIPIFAHLPFLLGKDRKKLSKRSGSVNLLDFDARGVLPDAMFNYLALLGWNAGGGETQEIYSRAELIEKFSLEGVNRAGAIFDEEKLAWMNAAYLKTLPIDEFLEKVRPTLGEVGADENYTKQAVEMARERIHGLPDILSQKERTKIYGAANFDLGAQYFFADEFDLDEEGAAKHLTEENRPRIQKLREKFEQIKDWNAQNLESAIRAVAEEFEVKPVLLVHPTRLLVAGKTVGPSLWELLEFLGRERVLRRMKREF